jgi:hypothetical protein
MSEAFLLSRCWKRDECANIWLFSENEGQYIADVIWRNSTNSVFEQYAWLDKLHRTDVAIWKQTVMTSELRWM